MGRRNRDGDGVFLYPYFVNYSFVRADYLSFIFFSSTCMHTRISSLLFIPLLGGLGCNESADAF